MFAVTLSAILLSIALGVANISLKEVSFSISSRASNDAFLAADTGAECALFYDKLAGSSFPINGENAPTEINCAGQTITLAPPVFGVDGTSYKFIITGLGSKGESCARVEVLKDDSVPEEPVYVSITSRGYNIGDGGCESFNIYRVERELLVSSRVGAKPAYVPLKGVVLKFDGSESPGPVPVGMGGTLSWTTSGVFDCTATAGPWSGAKSFGFGNEPTVNLSTVQIYTYTLTCKDVLNSSIDVPGSININVVDSWIYCADEGGTCSFSGSAVVRYGENNFFNYLNATGSIGCNNATFGDPINGTAKHCYYSPI